MQAAEGEAGRRRDGVLLGDADVVDAVGEALRERQQARRAQHRGGHRDDVVALVADLDELVGEDVGPRRAAARAADRLAGHRVDLADGVELVGLVVAGRAGSRGPSR